MKTEKPENISESVILETLSGNPSDFKVCAIGDKKRYDANRLLLGDNCRYEKDETIIKKENTDVVVICGEYQPSNQIMSDNVPMIYLYQLIDYKAKKFWDSKKEYIGVDLNHHESNPYIVEYQKRYQKISIRDIISKYFNKNGKRKLKLLSIGCGCGASEREFLGTNFFSEIHGCDISPESLQIAKNKAEEIDKNRIITYFFYNANSDDLKDKYDIIFVHNCVHHIERLEFFYENVRKALKPNGIFIQNEYTGAPRFQHSGISIKTVNLLLSLLPQRLKRKNTYQKIRMQDIILSDPSEAIRSDEIIPLTKKYFSKSKIWKFPCLIMHFLYQCVNADEFHTNKRRSLKLCSLVFNSERLLNYLGLVKPGGVLIVSEAKR